MPIYDLKCDCGYLEINTYCRHFDETVLCKKCGKSMHRLPVRVSVDVFPQDGIFLEHVSAEGKRFYSRKEMRDFERETGTILNCLH